MSSAKPGEKAIYEIGGIPVAVCGGDAVLRRSLDRRYAGFPGGPDSPALDLELAIGRAGRWASGRAGLKIEPRQGCWAFSNGTLRGEWDPDRRRVVLQNADDAAAIDYVLRIVHTFLLVPEGGFLLHASSVLRGGRAFLFTGPSGAGKTTISRLASADARLLADDTSYVRRCQSGYYAFGTPFGPTRAKRGVNVGAPVAGIYFLQQGRENRLDPIPAPEAMLHLMRSIRFFSDREMAGPEQAAMARGLFSGALRFLRETPAHRLVFTRDLRVWELLR